MPFRILCEYPKEGPSPPRRRILGIRPTLGRGPSTARDIPTPAGSDGVNDKEGMLRDEKLWPLAAGLLASLMGTGCDSYSEYHPAYPDQARFAVSHLGAYSSRLGDELEKQGTQFQTQWKVAWEKTGEGYAVERRLDTLEGRGYHKLTLARELRLKDDIVEVLDTDGYPVAIRGYDSLSALLGAIPQEDRYRKKLLEDADTAVLKAEERDTWRLRKLLEPGRYLHGQSLPVEALNAKLETVSLDSAKFIGARYRNGRDCVEYEAYYHRTDSLPLLVEMFFFSAAPNRRFRTYAWEPATVQGTRHFSLDEDTGLPCFEFWNETTELLLKHPKADAEQAITVFRYEEDVYLKTGK